MKEYDILIKLIVMLIGMVAGWMVGACFWSVGEEAIAILIIIIGIVIAILWVIKEITSNN